MMDGCICGVEEEELHLIVFFSLCTISVTCLLTPKDLRMHK